MLNLISNKGGNFELSKSIYLEQNLHNLDWKSLADIGL